ncbi:MAG: hypothetical protein ACI9DK_001604 [Vicingaceae bacterium]|jgi:hypothetical protein
MGRISQEKREEGILIKIKAFRDESKQKNLTVWLVFWTFCGIAIGSQLFVKGDDELRAFVFVYLAFWGYFEYVVIKAFKWRKSGEEQFLISEENFHYGRTYNNRGFLKPHRKDLVNAVKVIDEEIGTFAKVFGSSYWVVGGERLAFTVSGKVIPFGMQLTDKEVKQLKENLNKLVG